MTVIMKKKKLRLLLGITLSEMGGAQKVVYDLIASLPQEGYHMTLVTYPGGELVQWVEKLNQERTEKIKIILLRTLRREISPWNDLKTFLSLYRVIRKGKYDVVHLHSSKMGIIGRWAAWAAKVPKIIFTVHGWGINEYQPWILQKTLSLVERITEKVCHKIICVSRHHRDIGIENRWIHPQKASIIYNGISLPPYSKGQLRNELAIHEDTSIIGTIMRLRAPKEPLFTIEVFSEIKQQSYDIKLVIIGDGPLRSECENLIEKLQLREDVFLLGTRTDARELLNDMDIFTLFTKWEGLPLVIMEAMFAGKPIITSNVGGISELIVHGERGYLLEGFDVQEAVKTTKIVLENENLRKSLGSKGKEMAYEHFTKSRMVQEYQRIYEDEVIQYE